MIDFTGRTYEALKAEMLALVPNDVDKREASLVGTAVGPAAYALEDAYINLSRAQEGAHLQTAVGKDLDKCAADIGVVRKGASVAVRLGEFNIDVPVGARFSTSEAEPVNYTVDERVAAGRFRLACETAGSRGNYYSGPLIAITHIPGLTAAQLTDILIPGADAEEDEAFRVRCQGHLNAKPFGGNVADYREFVLGLPGVGGVQIYPTWNGGGTVKLSVVGADRLPASNALTDAVQTAVDPEQNSGQGYGKAPIGAAVVVGTPEAVPIAVVAAVTVAQGYTLGQVRPLILAALEGYLSTLREAWDATTAPVGTNYATVAYRARVTTAILLVAGVVNVTGLTLNGSDADVELVETGSVQQLPVLGEVTLTNGN